MRVWFEGQSELDYIEFREATHWEACGGDWVELTDDNENIVAILNWTKVRVMVPIP